MACYPDVPVIDLANPFYCPSISAASFLKRLQRHGRSQHASPVLSRHESHAFIQSFTTLLSQALLEESDHGTDSSPGSQYSRLKPQFARHVSQRARSSVDKISTSSALESGSMGFSLASVDDDKNFSELVLKRKRADDTTTSFSDLEGPTKYEKTLLSAYDSSFDVTLRRETLEFDSTDNDHPMPHKRVRTHSKETPGTNVKASEESPRGLARFIERLDDFLPGIRLKERLGSLTTHQGIANYLAENGLLNAPVLAILRTSEISQLSLTASLTDECGLNLAGQGIFPVFGEPNSFSFLRALSFSHASLTDFDLMHIHHLPHLSKLLLDDTGIGNEAVFLLVPLKRSLTELSLASNPEIDDAAVPALLLLSKLAVLSVHGTSVGMCGLGRFAEAILDDPTRMIDIKIPRECEQHIQNLKVQYILHPAPPLVVEPAICNKLSAAALRRNLAAHAAVNPTIVTLGSKAEMAERLRILLEARRTDLLVRDMIYEHSSDMMDV
ncbi:hypothetical protein FISHEDRAFT_67103 [Fistulina hepatica ATCC 64428]|uniref:RNI-like protein n=1 Tax=Fistulina hepatica ATCC 64428 TaxID=1128425 RepID=A0A0D7A5F4_9AGAR|nr:hypothetical protein FISHEDRAFT_67103 [Fistulina hepatica ATCC 64428]